MSQKIRSALISVFYKEGLEPIVRQLHGLGVTIYSTGGTQQFITGLNIPCVGVEVITGFPSILGGRVKTLHPSVFGGILGRRELESDIREMKEFKIPEIDLVIVDLYPFEETLARTDEEKAIIEKIDIGGPSMIRAAAKNFQHVAVIASKEDYQHLGQLLQTQAGELSMEQRRQFAAKAFQIVAQYDLAIYNYFNPAAPWHILNKGASHALRYGENPHQHAEFYGEWTNCFTQLHGKEISYNNLVDIDAAMKLIAEFSPSVSSSGQPEATFAIIKHTNACGAATRETVTDSWKAALQSDPESAFGGVLVCNQPIDQSAAELINEIFFEVLLAPGFQPAALKLLASKKNRILLQTVSGSAPREDKVFKSLLRGVIEQEPDRGNFEKWEEVGGKQTTASQKEDLIFANLVCKHLKSNAIALVKRRQLIGKGCGQTSRIDSLRQAIAKAKQFGLSLEGASLASDAFFPFNDCVSIAHAEGVAAFIQPGGSIRDKDSIAYCQEHHLAMVMTGMRHFLH